MSRGLAVLLTLLAILASSCEDDSCPATSCMSGLVVHVEDSDGSDVGPGTYEISVDDGVVIHAFECTVTATESNCVEAVPPQDPRDPPGQASVFLIQGQAFVIDVWITDDEGVVRGPDATTISVSRDGIEIGTRQLTPAYEFLEPFGPRCGSCWFAEEVWKLPLGE